MNVGIVGTGYVGLGTGGCLAERGSKVLCVDSDPEVVRKLSSGEVTIFEPGLEEIFLRNVKKERIAFTGDLEAVALSSRVLFLCLPTPPDEDGSAALQYILRGAEESGRVLAGRPGAPP